MIATHFSLVRPAPYLLAGIVAVSLMLPTGTPAAALDNTFHPLITDDVWYPLRVVVMPDDSFVALGNSFDRLSGEKTGPLVRFRPDGSRDRTFQFNQNVTYVAAAAATNEGQLVISSTLQTKDRRSSSTVSRLNADGSTDPAFTAPVFDDPPRSIAIQPDGKILVGGAFTKVNEMNRSFLVRLNANGSLDTSFAAISLTTTGAPFSSRTGIYTQILIQPDKKIVIGGAFDHLNGVAAGGVARLNSNGSRDASFQPSGWELSESSGQRRPVRGLALQADGGIIVSARFAESPLGWPPSVLIRLYPDGSLSHSLLQGSTGESRALGILPNQQIVMAGNILYRFMPDGHPAEGYPRYDFKFDALGTGATPTDLAVQSSGSFVVAGVPYVDQVLRSGLARFLPDGKLAPKYIGRFEGAPSLKNVASTAAGKIYISGGFSHVNGTPRPGIARLLANGDLDSSFDPAALGYTDSDRNSSGFALHPDGKVLLFGYKQWDFTYARLLPNGQPDPAFIAAQGDQPRAQFSDVVLEPDGSYLAINSIYPSDILSDSAIFHLLADGLVDDQFALPFRLSEVAVVRHADESVQKVYLGDNRAIAFLADGKMLLRYFDASGHYKLIRLNKNGSSDPSFAEGAVAGLSASSTETTVFDPHTNEMRPATVIRASGAELSDAVFQQGGKTIVVGRFTNYNGVAAPGIVRLLENGTVDSSFKPGGGAQWTTAVADATHVPQIDSIQQQPDGRLLIAGNFDAYDGVAAPGIARLNPNGTIDTTFTPPAELRDGGPFLPFAPGQIYPDRNGKYFLTGRYAAPGQEWPHSLLRFNITTPPLLNISTRARVLGGDSVLIGGFIITGNEPKTILLRGLGPSLSTNEGPVPGRLPDPFLQLFNGATELDSNDNWKETQQSQITESGVPPTNALESAIIATLAPGEYTAVLSGKDGASGIGLFEAYDLNQGASAKFANISTRGFVDTGDQVMIGGFIVANPATRVIVRAIGSSLSGDGVDNALSDPTLQIVNGSGVVVRSNDNWKSDQQAEIEKTNVPPNDDAESAIVATLAPGSYTAVVSGKASATGVALVEVFALQ